MRLNHRRRRHRLAILGLGLAVSLAVAAPAAAKAPLFPHRCPERVDQAAETQPYQRGVCGKADTASAAGSGLSDRNAAILAGSVALLVLAIAAGMLVATHRRDAHRARPRRQHRSDLERLEIQRKWRASPRDETL